MVLYHSNGKATNTEIYENSTHLLRLIPAPASSVGFGSRWKKFHRASNSDLRSYGQNSITVMEKQFHRRGMTCLEGVRKHTVDLMWSQAAKLEWVTGHVLSTLLNSPSL